MLQNLLLARTNSPLQYNWNFQLNMFPQSTSNNELFTALKSNYNISSSESIIIVWSTISQESSLINILAVDENRPEIGPLQLNLN